MTPPGQCPSQRADCLSKGKWQSRLHAAQVLEVPPATARSSTDENRAHFVSFAKEVLCNIYFNVRRRTFPPHPAWAVPVYKGPSN